MLIQECIWDYVQKKTASDFKITRKEQDDFGLESYKRTKEATEKGYFKNELISVSVTDKKKKEQYM